MKGHIRIVEPLYSFTNQSRQYLYVNLMPMRSVCLEELGAEMLGWIV